MSRSAPSCHVLQRTILLSALTLLYVVADHRDATAQQVTFTQQTTVANAGQKFPVTRAIQPARLIASLPLDKQKVKGFTVSVVVDQLNEAGYLPVDITVTSTSVFSADRNLSLRMEPVELSQSPPQSGIAVDIPINVTQASKQVHVIRHIPKWSVGTHYELRVFEDGRELEDYTSVIGQLISRSYRVPTELLANESNLNWLQISQRGVADTTTNSATLYRGIDNNSFASISRFNPSGWASGGHNTVSLAAIANVPTDWRYFQSYDGLLISKADLQTVAEQQGELLSVIRDWVMSGGTVIVIGVESIAETCQLMNFAEQPAFSDRELLTNLRRTATVNIGHIQQTLNSRKAYMQSIINNGGQPNPAVGFVATAAEAVEEVKRIDRELELLSQWMLQSGSSNSRIWSQRVSAGRVIGVAAEPTQIEWRTADELFGFRRSTTLRRGVDPIIGDQRATRWMIPGVAQPPVKTFMGLLAVFVVLVGPVAYRSTTKAGRGYLMFAIAPVLALTTTLAMLTYGVLSDGFGTSVRVRQLTWVDGHSGDGFDRTRATYFAGVRPSAGLRFAGDAEVMEYPNYNGKSWVDLNRNSFVLKGNVRIDQDHQVFDSSFLPSRDQRQFVIHQPRRNIGNLSINRPTGADPLLAPTLDSSFAFVLGDVVICDADGLYWSVQNIGPGQTGVTCRRLLKTDASKMLGKMYNDHRPIAPTGERGGYNQSNYQVRDIIVALNRGINPSKRLITDGIFEDWLQIALQIDGEIPRNSFIALSGISDDVIAVPGTNVVESVRYVFGSLP